MPLELISGLSSEASDAELMRQLAAGEMSPLGELYQRYARMVRSAIAKIAPNMSVAAHEDICQEVFITVGETAHKYQEQLRFRAWLYSIAVKKTLNRSKGSWLRRKLLRNTYREGTWERPRSAPSPAAVVECRDQIASILAKLPSGQREVMLLHAEGFSGKEIAAILSIKENTVWTRLHRARWATLALAEQSSSKQTGGGTGR